ncbi:hypothetical protein [Streptomyces capillispiralis]|uniref:hypothetical protein n=1 Tax=Streptomyces capillispiralis TaxID=68182 RepID=UPI00142EAE25|nr:hypothetical protein [Streptomyces capillispiralis]GHH94459.1 hypothetical protein GCM10017779_49160 [Streptomyces capillispiralis]
MDRPSAEAAGARFVHVEATEATTYRDPRCARRHQGSRRAGRPAARRGHPPE